MRISAKHRPKPDTTTAMQRVRSMFRGAGRRDVQRYLKQHPLMIDVLLHTGMKILDDYFHGAVLTVEYVGGKNNGRLLIGLDSNMDGLDAVPLFEHFDEEWVIAELLNCVSSLSFDLEYR